MSARRFAVGVALGLLAGLPAGVALDRGAPALLRGSGPDFGLLHQAWRTIDRAYVDRSALAGRRLTYGALSGMVNALGDTGHSVFLTPEMVRQEQVVTRGSLVGIGAELELRNGEVVVVAPLDGSPAQAAGLRPGDVVVKVDGASVAGLSLRDVVERIHGPVKTAVTLTVRDPGTDETRRLTLLRAEVALRSVTWHLLPGGEVAHVRIASFSRGTSSALQQALKAVASAGARAVVLDLRSDPGGLLDEAIGVASQLLRGGSVLQVKDARGRVRSVSTRAGAPVCSLPAVVLVNAGTASAAEIVSGALQDAGRAVLVGQRTFGTGTVLQEFPLADGSALLLAIEEWLTPKGRTLWHKGIVPDVVVALPAGVAPLVPEQEGSLTPAQVSASRDLQLLRGLELLVSGAIPRGGVH